MEFASTVAARGHQFPLQGSFDPAFVKVAEAFAENFKVDDEVGSAVSVVQDGKAVVDLWGGWRDAGHSLPWQRDTIVCMMSVAKGVTGICFNMLIDRGLVEIDAPVARYWPEFAQAGKEGVLVRHILDHTAGLPVLTTNKLWPGAMFDREAMCNALAMQAPLWEPGKVAAYHVHTQGYLLGEIMRRVTGKTVSAFLRDEVAGPLGLDYYIGNMPQSAQDRCAQVMPNLEARLFAAKDVESPDSLRGLAFLQNPAEPWPVTLNSRIWREAEVASGNGHGNARAVARLYGALARGGEIDGVRLMSSASIEQMITEQHNMRELLQERPYHQALGILLNSPGAVFMGPNPRAFGHHGIGGSIGMADPDAGIGFSYSINRMHAVGDNGPRARRLIEAVFESL